MRFCVLDCPNKQPRRRRLPWKCHSQPKANLNSHEIIFALEVRGFITHRRFSDRSRDSGLLVWRTLGSRTRSRPESARRPREQSEMCVCCPTCDILACYNICKARSRNQSNLKHFFRCGRVSFLSMEKILNTTVTPSVILFALASMGCRRESDRYNDDGRIIHATLGTLRSFRRKFEFFAQLHGRWTALVHDSTRTDSETWNGSLILVALKITAIAFVLMKSLCFSCWEKRSTWRRQRLTMFELAMMKKFQDFLGA